MPFTSEEKTIARSQTAFAIGSIGLFISAAAATIAGVIAFLQLYYEPANLIWSVVYALVIAAILAFFLTKKYALLTRATAWTTGILLFIVLVFSGNGPALVACAWLAALSAGLGILLMRWLKLGSEDAPGERLLMGAALGIGVLALLSYALGAAHIFAGGLGLPTRYFKLLHPLPVFVSLALLSAISAPGLVRVWKAFAAQRAQRLRAEEADHQAATALCAGIAFLCFLPIFLWALSPTIRFDAIVYHLAAPVRYASFHGLLEINEPVHFYLSHYAEMLNTLALIVAGQPLPGLLHLLSGLITFGLTVLLANRLGFARIIGWAAGLLFFSLPLYYDAGTVHNDFYIAMFSLASFYAILAWWQDHKTGWLIAAGTLAGLSIGVKINAAMPALAGGLAILAGQTYCRTPWKKMALELAGYALPIVLMYAPWAVLNAVWTSNPFFPFFCQTLACSSEGFNGMPVEGGTFLPSLLNNFLLLPWNVTFFGDQYYIENFGGAAGAVFLLSLPWLYAFRQTGQQFTKTARLLAAFSVLNFLLLIPFSHRVRYTLPILPILCILAAINLYLAWQYLRRLPGKRAWAAAGIALLGLYFFSTRLVVTSSGWQMEERYPYRVALGLETPDAYLSRTLPAYDALQFLNDNADAEVKIASIGDETRIYTQADVRTFYFSGELAKILTNPQTPINEIARGLQAQGYRYVLYHPAGVAESDYPIDRQLVGKAFLKKYARLVFARNDVFLYELFPTADPAAAEPGGNLLENGGFEESDGSGAVSGWMVYNNPQVDTTATQAGDAAILASDLDYVYQRVPVEGGELYTLGHWSRGGAGGEPVRLQVMWLDRAASPISVTIEYVEAGATWTWNQLSYSAPEEAIFAQVYITTGTSQAAWFDTVCFTKGPDCEDVQTSAP